MNNALFSIKPKHVDNILAGNKTVELRSRTVNLETGTTIWIYSTLPNGCISAYATIDKIHQATPSNIWKEYSEEIAISKKEFDEYVLGKATVSAICLKDIYQIEPAISLEELRNNTENFHPPQFFKKFPLNHSFIRYMHSLLDINVPQGQALHFTC